MLESCAGVPYFQALAASGEHLFFFFGCIGVWMVLCMILFAGLRGVGREFN